MKELLERHDPTSIALSDPERDIEISFAELVDKVATTAGRLRRAVDRGLVFLFATNSIESVVLYLACLEAQCPVCLLEQGLTARLLPLLDAYQPTALLIPARVDAPDGFASDELLTGDYRMLVRMRDTDRPEIHPALALLLTTSGSTGNPRLVRLTLSNLVANATSISTYLGIGPGERAILSLPMQYSYGLSVVNSHLFSGATLVVTAHSYLRPEFWATFDRAHCTSVAGVPYVYETLNRLRFDPARHPTLRTMTQAGGGLRPDLIQWFYERANAAGCRFFVMYGQTEATARIAYVPWEQLSEKVGSIGIAIPGGKLSLAPVDESEKQQLVYEGANVMMGYANSAADLASGDVLGGILPTGDLATKDADGFYFLAGRLNRFAKLFGKRIDLEDMEREVERLYTVQAVVVEYLDGLRVYVASADGFDTAAPTRHLAELLNIPPRFIATERIDAVPRTASGKKDYRALST